MSQFRHPRLRDKHDLIIAEIGDSTDLSPTAAVQAGLWLKAATDRAPHHTVCLALRGYDDDDRGLWEIPEARAYLVATVRAAGVADWRAPLVRRFNEATIVLLVMCEALGDDHPFIATIDTDASPL